MVKCNRVWVTDFRCEGSSYWGFPSNHQCQKEFEVESHVHECSCGAIDMTDVLNDIPQPIKTENGYEFIEDFDDRVHEEEFLP